MNKFVKCQVPTHPPSDKLDDDDVAEFDDGDSDGGGGGGGMQLGASHYAMQNCAQ